MSLSDPIADALTMVRNAARVNKEKVDLRASGLVAEILKILKQQRFVHDFRRIEDKKQGILRVYLKKSGESLRRISRIQRVSRPGLRIYAKKDRIPTVLNGLGVCIVSTPEGVLTGDQAKRRNLGGEVLLKIW